jgi:hypothetical protein
MYQSPELFISYKHIQAKTPEKLEQIQVNSQMPIDFKAPSYSEGQWHTWFLYDHSKDIRPQDKLLMKGKKYEPNL